MRLEGKIVLITGAGSGIGRALAIKAAKHGAVLYLVGRRAVALAETKALLPPGTEAHCVEADITTPAGRAAIRIVLDGGDRPLDILINNAGAIASAALPDCSDAISSRLIDTNLTAPILLTRDLLPALKRSAAPRLVNVGSVYGDIAMPGFAIYAATKFGLRGFSDAMRRELAPDGVTVTYVAPRATQTEGVAEIAASLERQGAVLDDPTTVAEWIWSAIDRKRRNAYPPTAERFFVALQRICPAAVDRALRTCAR